MEGKGGPDRAWTGASIVTSTQNKEPTLYGRMHYTVSRLNLNGFRSNLDVGARDGCGRERGTVVCQRLGR